MSWTAGLKCRGLYYEGWVGSLDECLSRHAKATVTCYGTRRSNKTSGSAIEMINDKENTDKKTQKVHTYIFDWIVVLVLYALKYCSSLLRLRSQKSFGSMASYH